MNFKSLMFALLTLMAGVMVSCNNESRANMEAAGENVEDAAQASAAEMEQETAELGREIETAQANVNRRIQEIEADMENATDEAKVEMQQELDEMREYGRKLDERAARLGQNMEDGWDEFKADTRTFLLDVERFFDPEGDLE